MKKDRTLATVVIVSCLALLLSGCSLFDQHANLTIAAVVDEDAYPDLPDVTTNPVETTEDVCGAAAACVEAWSTDEADYYRFASRDQATDYAATLDDGFVSHYIVMDFHGKDATIEAQQQAMEQLANNWQDYEGAYPDRG